MAELSLWGKYHLNPEPVLFARELVQVPQLERLDLGNNPWKEIPDWLTELEFLEELRLDYALMYLKKLPDLTLLPRLKTLRLGGGRFYEHQPIPSPTLLPQIFEVENLETLALTNWGEIWNEGVQCRQPLDIRYLQGIGKLKKLRFLLLAHNQLKEIPREIFQMQQLEYIDLSSNCLPVSEIKALQENLPHTLLNIRNNRANDQAPDISHMLNRAAAYMQDYKEPEALKKALELYNYLRTLADSLDEYKQLYIYYGIAYCSAHYLFKLPASAGTEAERLTIIENDKQACRKILALTTFIMPFGDEIEELKKSARKTAANSIGYYCFTENAPLEKIKEAITYLESVRSYLGSPHDFYILDTYVRLLLTAGRKEEAYEQIAYCLKCSPDFPEFAAFKTDPDYQTWAASR